MTFKINRPTDDYSPDWAAYWAQNPHMLRSVGADAAGGGEGEGKGSGEGEGDGSGGDDVDYKSMVAKLEAQNKELLQKAETFEAKHREAEKHRKAKEEEARKAAEEAAKKSGDVEALEKSWHEKFEAAVSEKSQEAERLQQMVYSLTVGSTATGLAAKIAMDGCADGLKPHIQSRLKTEIVDGEPVVKVLGKDGKPSAMTIDDLEKELKATPYLAPLIKGSSASGGGGLGGRGSAGKGEMDRAEFDKLPPVKQREVINKGVKVV